MADRVEDSYLGWELLEHAAGCARPVWTVDVRTADAYRYVPRTFGDEPAPPPHSCPDEDCGHRARFRETTVRVVCTSCGAAHLIRGEERGQTSTTTQYLGYGLPPRRMAGLWLYPGQPWLDLGRADEHPHDFVVTAARVARVTAADVVGTITQGRGSRGAVRWKACAVPCERNRYDVRLLAFAAALDGLRTVAAGAKWIAAQLAAAGGEGRG